MQSRKDGAATLRSLTLSPDSIPASAIWLNFYSLGVTGGLATLKFRSRWQI
jgi:hypothetical protein